MIKMRARCKACIWSCSKCGLTIQGDSVRRPGSNGCTAGGCHNWKYTYL